MTDLFFDFLCPYAWRGIEMAAVLRGHGEHFRLRHFSLVQGNHAKNQASKSAADVQWWLSDQPLTADGGEGYMQYQQPSLNAFLAAIAVAKQNEEANWNFTLALLREVHEQKKPLGEESIQQAAVTAGLDLKQFAQDRLDEMSLRSSLHAELAEAAEIGVFGTPTFVLADGSAAYFRFENLSRNLQTAKQYWKLYRLVLASEAGIATIKRAKNRPAAKF